MTDSTDQRGAPASDADGGVRRVLHVLPHPGGGGETYVDLLDGMPGYRFERAYLAERVDARGPLPIARAMLDTLIRSRGFDLVHVQGEPAALLVLPALRLRPSIVTPNGLHLLRRVDGLERTVAERNLQAVTAAADYVIAVSEAERDEIESVVGPTQARRKVALVHNGVVVPEVDANADDVRRAVRAELDVHPSAVVALCVGELSLVKDPLTAARACLATPETSGFVLAFAGDGALRGELESLARSDPSSRIRVLGRRRDLPRLYTAADIIVLSSEREGLPFALLEGMSYGLAPIVSDAPGSLDAAGDTALVVRRGDVSGFAEAFERLSTGEAERRSRGTAARIRVVTRFDARMMVERTELLYDDVTERRRG